MVHNYKKYTICTAIIFMINSCMFICVAQVPKFCGFDELFISSLEQKNFKESNDSMEQIIFHKTLKSFNLGQYNQHLRSSGHILPIVIHVISPPNEPLGSPFNPNDMQILSGLEELNDAFSNRNFFNSNTGIDTKITFCLATRNQNNQPFNGINRVESHIVNKTRCGTDPSTDYDDYQQIVSLGGWDCCEYINIYLVTNLFNQNSCGLRGFATFPSNICNNTHGIVVQSSDWNTRFGTQIMTHEMGHFLGLYHTFHGGCVNNNCLIDGDRVCDTPPDQALHSPCTFNSCNTDTDAPFPNQFTTDVIDDTENYMDYSSCYSHFTSGQTERMLFYLENFRACLTNSMQCSPWYEKDIAIINYQVYNKCSGKYCVNFKLRNVGVSNINKIKVHITINGLLHELELITNLVSGDMKDFDLGCFELPDLGLTNYKIEIVEIDNLLDENMSNNIVIGSEIIRSPITPSRLDIVKSSCGLNGRISIEFQDIRIDSFTLSNLDTMIVNHTGDFSSLTNGEYTLTLVLRDFDCSPTFVINIEDECPPCISGIINRYYEVLDIDCSKRKITLNNTTQLLGGDQVVVIQMKGALLYDTNSESHGNVDDIGSAGNYEINWVESVNNDTVILRYPLVRDYNKLGIIQIVYMPVFDDVVVCNLTCKDWDGKTGGVLAFEGNGIVEFAGNIDVSGKGFRRGLVSNNYYSGNCFYSAWAVSDVRYGQKGEGISSQYNLRDRGMGRNANGGGGANPVNTGGGGGGLYGSGGRGGFQYEGCQVNNNAFGRGGESLSSFINMNKLFLGGGGGGGQQNDNLGGSGANGGGIVIIKASEVSFSNSRILAEGLNAINGQQNRQYDGKGGGGAGGMVLLEIAKNPSQIMPISVQGGAGGDIFETMPNSLHGPGGGGGGGLIGLNGIESSVINANVLGGNPGINKLTNNHWGAMGGQNGITLEEFSLFYSEKELPYKWVFDTFFYCDIGYEVQACLTGGVITFVGGVQTQRDSCVLINTFDTIQLVAEIQSGCTIDTILTNDPFTPLRLEILFHEDSYCDSSGWIHIEGFGGIPPYKFYINNSEKPSGSFQKLIPGIYNIGIMDISGCLTDTVVEIKQIIFDPPVVELINSIEPYCVSDFGQLHFRIDSIGIFSLKLYGEIYEMASEGIFDSLRVGVYFLQLTDERGCVYEYGPFQIESTVEGVLNILNFTICENDFIVNLVGDTLSVQGIYEVLIDNGEECDSVYIYNLVVIENAHQKLLVEICEGEKYFYEGDTLYNPGNYEYNFTNSFGCDSTVIIELELLDKSYYYEEIILCTGDSIEIENNVIRTPGDYTFVLINELGCDSIYTLKVDVVDFKETFLDTMICENQNLIFQDFKITESGEFIFKLNSSDGCDSIITLNVNYKEIFECDQCLIFVPNAFSPNKDGINDTFMPIPINANPMQLIIFNRWGDIVYDSKLNFSWDGIFNGKKLNPNVFLYTLKIQCSDGAIKTLNGEITLIE